MGQPLPSQDHHKAVSPVETHFRPATCEEVDCPDWFNGFDAFISTDDEARLYYIRYDPRCGQQFVETQESEGLVRFRFPPGQRCFKAYDHKIRLDRAPIYLLNQTRMEGTQWIDDLSEGLYKGHRLISRG